MTHLTTHLTIQLTCREVQILADLASDQLFRREFIDPKMPGSQINRADIAHGKELVERLRVLLDPRSQTTRPTVSLRRRSA